MARAKAMTERISSAERVRPYGGIIADFPSALPPSVMMFCTYWSLSALSLSPSFSSGGTGVKFERFDGPAGVESAWHQTQYR
jgi:hypothetical protein